MTVFVGCPEGCRYNTASADFICRNPDGIQTAMMSKSVDEVEGRTVGVADLVQKYEGLAKPPSNARSQNFQSRSTINHRSAVRRRTKEIPNTAKDTKDNNDNSIDTRENKELPLDARDIEGKSPEASARVNNEPHMESKELFFDSMDNIPSTETETMIPPEPLDQIDDETKFYTCKETLDLRVLNASLDCLYRNKSEIQEDKVDPTNDLPGRQDSTDVRMRHVPELDPCRDSDDVDYVSRASTVSCYGSGSMSKVEMIVNEMFESEKKYVSRLCLVDEEFRNELSRLNRTEYVMTWDSLTLIFSNIHDINRFHKEFLLPRLEKCAQSENGYPGEYPGKVFSELAPFLKMYSEYVKNYKQSIQIITKTKEESTKFSQFVEDFETRSNCEGLKIQSFFIEPVQRVPRYELLMKDYIKYLPDESPDLKDAHRALLLVRSAAIHSNNFMKIDEKFVKVQEVRNKIRDDIDLLSSPRELVKEGTMTTVLPISGREEDRYIILFSDMVLVCKFYPHAVRPPYKIVEKMDVSQMSLNVVGSTFYVMGKQSVVELAPSTELEKTKWIEAFNSVISKDLLRDKSNRHSDSSASIIKKKSLGTMAPIMLKDHQVDQCMQCCQDFTLLRRRRSCWACGRIVCKDCSENKWPLAYAGNREKRVCNSCYSKLYAEAYR